MKFLYKVLKIILVLIIIYFVILFFIIDDSSDFCLDSGYCKEGLVLNINNKAISINEQTCRENDGIWLSSKKLCKFDY